MVLNWSSQSVIVDICLQRFGNIPHYSRPALVTHCRHASRNWRGREISEDVLLERRKTQQIGGDPQVNTREPSVRDQGAQLLPIGQRKCGSDRRARSWSQMSLKSIEQCYVEGLPI